LLPLLSGSGCSWFMNTRVVDRQYPGSIDCSKTPALADTVLAVGQIAGGIAMAATIDTGDGSKSTSGKVSDGLHLASGTAVQVGTGIGISITGMVQGIAALTGWAKYSNCREERASIEANMPVRAATPPVRSLGESYSLASDPGAASQGGAAQGPRSLRF
jgi:hypothetical protein